MCYYSLIMIKNNKIIRYIFSGIIASLSNFVILYFLVQKLNLWYLTSSIISFCCGIIISYCLQKFFTFKNYSIQNIHLQFSVFFIYNLCMLGLNTLLMYFFVDIIGIWYLFSQIVITIGTAFINYFFFNKIMFNKNEGPFTV
jgi:putative flippase GtrA